MNNPFRRGYQNGYYTQGLLTGFGYVEDLKVPRMREGGNSFKTIKRFEQRSKEVDELLKGMFLKGGGLNPWDAFRIVRV